MSGRAEMEKEIYYISPRLLKGVEAVDVIPRVSWPQGWGETRILPNREEPIDK
jgi:hypothetical protein